MLKFLLCDTENETIASVKKAMGVLAPEANLSYCNCDDAFIYIQLFQPDFIFTDSNFWSRGNAVEMIKQWRLQSHAPVIIYSVSVNKVMLSCIFDVPSIHFIKQTLAHESLNDLFTTSIKHLQ